MALFAGRAEVSSDLASAVALLEKHAILRAEGVEGVGEGPRGRACVRARVSWEGHARLPRTSRVPESSNESTRSTRLAISRKQQAQSR